MGFGTNLKQELENQNKTVAWLSKESNIAASTLYSIIKRDNEPNLETVYTIANALKVPHSKLLDTGELWFQKKDALLEISRVEFTNALSNFNASQNISLLSSLKNALEIISRVNEEEVKDSVIERLTNLIHNYGEMLLYSWTYKYSYGDHILFQNLYIEMIRIVNQYHDELERLAIKADLKEFTEDIMKEENK